MGRAIAPGKTLFRNSFYFPTISQQQSSNVTFSVKMFNKNAVDEVSVGPEVQQDCLCTYSVLDFRVPENLSILD